MKRLKASDKEGNWKEINSLQESLVRIKNPHMFFGMPDLTEEELSDIEHEIMILLEIEIFDLHPFVETLELLDSGE